MTTGQALLWATKKLSRHKVGIPTAMSGKKTSDRNSFGALDAEVLLSFSVDKTRGKILTHPEAKLSTGQFKKFSSLIARRGRREPVAYITGKKEFFGLDFAVNKSVLIPRSETEMLVEETIAGIKNQEAKIKQIIDVGTGSGAIAVALAKNLPKIKIIATDVSSAALKLAQANSRRHKVGRRIKFIKTDLLPPLKAISHTLPAMIVANLPYLPTHVWKNAMPDVKNFEPKNALLGGTDGLDIIKKLLSKIKEQKLRGIILLEIDPSQKTKLPKIIKTIFPSALTEIKKDLAGLFRIIKIILK